MTMIDLDKFNISAGEWDQYYTERPTTADINKWSHFPRPEVTTDMHFQHVQRDTHEIRNSNGTKPVIVYKLMHYSDMVMQLYGKNPMQLGTQQVIQVTPNMWADATLGSGVYCYADPRAALTQLESKPEGWVIMVIATAWVMHN